MKTLLLILLLVPMMSFGQNVNIPDANFKNYLVNNSSINTNGDSEIQTSEASAFAGTINVGLNDISDLTGIETFTALTELRCYENYLTSLNLSNNTALTYLSCSENYLTSLNLSNLSALIQLKCWENSLTSLDVSSCNSLEMLDCDYNNLTSLDLSNNSALTVLGCADNSLISLDVSNNTSLTELYCSENDLICLNIKNGNNINLTDFYAETNPSLTCIEVDNVSFANNNWISNIDNQTSFSENCNNACSNTSSISELNTTPKQLINIVDVLGRETPFKPNTPLLYIYNDGTVERKMIIKE